MVNPSEEAIVRCETSTGTVTMQMRRRWSPNGYDRAVELFEKGFYDQSHFYRVVPNFLVQFGISYSENHELQSLSQGNIMDDPSINIPFHPGTISYAGSGDNSRTSQLFISYGSAASLGTQKWETPIGEVIEGMENVQKLYSYGDMPPWGAGPVQQKIHGHPEYIEENFPLTDKFHHCKVERLNTGGNDAPGKVVKKKDGATDEEEYQKKRSLKRNGDRDHNMVDPNKRLADGELADAGNMGIYFVIMGIGLVLMVFVAYGSRKKINSKKN